MQFPAELLTRCCFLCGPTACGKTELSLVLAEQLNAEIIALDSMTLYRGMDIGTAKPSLVEQSRVPHHLIDVVDPHEEFSLAEYLTAAEAACREIVARGHRPLFVGGTGLYLRGVLRGVFEGPAADWNLRRELEAKGEQEGYVSLHQELQQVDPRTAARLHPNDVRRVIRALEVFRLTGLPMSAQHEQGPRPLEQRTAHVYWLSPEREWLYERINRRVVQMFEQGLLDEIYRLRKSPMGLSHTARQALGYKEVLDRLQAAETLAEADIGEVIELIQVRTRQFAKRQYTWFRNLDECVSISIEDNSIAALANQLAARINQAG